MAQGFVRAVRNVADTTIFGLATREQPIVANCDTPLVRSPVPATRHLSGSFNGQQLSGTGALVWEGEVLDLPSRNLVH